MPKSDEMPLTVDCSYSNIGEEWCAQAFDENGKSIAHGKASTLPDALRELADELEALE